MSVTKDSKKGIHVSASALKDYIACSQKAYFRIFEAGEAVQSKEMLMGSITHKVLEKEWRDVGSAVTLGNKLCEKNNLDAQSKQAVEHFIHTYFERFNVMVRKDDKIESRFKVKIHEDVYLVGVFDRISKGTVIDWKTDANPPKKISNSVQFIIYDWAYKLIYDKPAEGLYLAALKDGSLVRYSESKEHSTTLIEGVIPQFIEDVRRKNFTKTGLFTGACFRCPFKQPCLGDAKDVNMQESA